MESYKLIKKLPFVDSPEIGYISKSKKGHRLHYWNHNWFDPKDYPEFWEKIIEKDYEILAFKQDSLCEDLWTEFDQGWCRNSNGKPVTCPYSDDQILNNHLRGGIKYYIHSVKRLSDGEVFTVGDRILRTDINDKYTIDKFEIQDNELKVYLIGMCVGVSIDNIQKIKQPLFTTEDGVDIYKGDEVTSVNLDTLKTHATTPVNTGESLKYGNYKYFSTKEAAEEYILMNKPCLSINEVIDLYIKTSLDSIFVRNTFITRLKQFIK